MAKHRKRKAIVTATKDIGELDAYKAYKQVAKLVDESGVPKKRIAECIGKTDRMLHLALTTSQYPLILMEVLECLGYDVENIMRLTIKTPKGEGE